MMLLGLDLASRLCGWCAGDGAQLPDCGAWELESAKNEDGSYEFGRMLASLEDYLGIAFRRFQPEAVAYECPLLIPKRFDPKTQRMVPGDNLGKLRLLYPLSAFVEWYCFKSGVPCYEVTVAAIKKEVTGNAYAEKDDLVAVARKVGLALPAGEGAKDASDAWGAWLLLLRAFNPEASREFDRRIWTPKGAML